MIGLSAAYEPWTPSATRCDRAGREHQAVEHQARRLRAAQQGPPIQLGGSRLACWTASGTIRETAAAGDETVGCGEQRVEADGRSTRLKCDRILVGPLRPQLRGQLVERYPADILCGDAEAAKNHVPYLAVARHYRPATPDARATRG